MLWNNVAILAMAFCLPGGWPSHSLAQATPPITSSGLNTEVNLSSTPLKGQVQYDITGGTRAGTNLFHSFGDFNVPNNHVANFLNDTGLATTNILGRVTDGNTSNIFGTIQTTGFENTNLFLMNPAGIVFGPTALLNIGGSVTFTTSNYLRLSEINGKTGIFHADSALPSVLTSAPVAAFGFLGPNQAAIAVLGSTLTTQPGQSISLLGGNITVKSGTLANNRNQPAHPNTSASRIHLASVTSPGEIVAERLDYAPNINGQSFGALGAIQVFEKSVIDASGNGGGSVLIRGGQLVLDNSRISANVEGSGAIRNGVEFIGSGIDIAVSQDAMIRNGAVIETNVSRNATPNIDYVGVQVKANHIEIAGTGGFLSPFTGIRSNVGTDAEPSTKGGNSGNIILDSNSILINRLGTLETTVRGLTPQPDSSPSPPPISKAGDITLTANQDIELSGSRIQSLIFSHSGAAGDITLTSKHGNILESGNLVPPESQETPGVFTPPVTNMLFAQSLRSAGKAGDVTFNAPEGDIRLAGAQIVLTLQPLPDGPPTQEAGSGQVSFAAKNLQLINGSTVQMDNFSTRPVGDFNVSLNGSLALNNSRIITTARGSAQAAGLNIKALNVIITDSATLSTETVSLGSGGHLNLITNNLQLINGGQLRSGSTIPPQFPGSPPPPLPTGSGGVITVGSQESPTDHVLIDGLHSGIFTNTEGTGLGGTVTLSAKALTIQNGGTISASTTGTDTRATGGSIIVNSTNNVTLTNGGSITASSVVNPKTPNSGIADAGKIFINAGRQLDLLDRSSVTTTTQSAKANGGNIDIRAIDRVRLVNDSKISTSVEGAEGSGGNIFIDPNVVILEGSQVTARAVGGAGGNITFVTPLFLADSASVVSATSQRGVSGTVLIQSPTSNLSGTVGQLVSKASPPQVLLQNRCVALAGGEQSTFVLASRDALPSEPGGWLSSPVSMEHWMGEDTEHATGLIAGTRKLNEPRATVARVAQGEVLSLRRLTPPGFLVRTFATGTTGCPS